MCAFSPLYYSSAYIEKRRNKIKYKKIHKFASDRWLKANTVRTAKFWKSVMGWCVVVEKYYELREKAYDKRR